MSTKSRKLSRDSAATDRRRSSTMAAAAAAERSLPEEVKGEEEGEEEDALAKSVRLNGLLLAADGRPDYESLAEPLSIKETEAISVSLERSRRSWLLGSPFEKFWSRPQRGRKHADGTNSRDLMSKFHDCTAIIGPHSFVLRMYSVKDENEPKVPKGKKASLGGGQVASPGYGAPVTPGYATPSSQTQTVNSPQIQSSPLRPPVNQPMPSAPMNAGAPNPPSTTAGITAGMASAPPPTSSVAENPSTRPEPTTSSTETHQPSESIRLPAESESATEIKQPSNQDTEPNPQEPHSNSESNPLPSEPEPSTNPEEPQAAREPEKAQAPEQASEPVQEQSIAKAPEPKPIPPAETKVSDSPSEPAPAPAPVAAQTSESTPKESTETKTETSTAPESTEMPPPSASALASDSSVATQSTAGPSSAEAQAPQQPPQQPPPQIAPQAPPRPPAPPPPRHPNDGLIERLHALAAADPQFGELMKVVASGKASPEDIRRFQVYIQEHRDVQPLPRPLLPATASHGSVGAPYRPYSSSPYRQPVARTPMKPKPEPKKVVKLPEPLKPLNIVFEFREVPSARYVFPKMSLIDEQPDESLSVTFFALSEGPSLDGSSGGVAAEEVPATAEKGSAKKRKKDEAADATASSKSDETPTKLTAAEKKALKKKEKEAGARAEKKIEPKFYTPITMSLRGIPERERKVFAISMKPRAEVLDYMRKTASTLKHARDYWVYYQVNAKDAEMIDKVVEPIGVNHPSMKKRPWSSAKDKEKDMDYETIYVKSLW